MAVFEIYAVSSDILIGESSSLFYLLESLAFFSWAVVLMTRYERKTNHDIDCGNILLAFYKGDNGTFTMRFFELFGRSVQSICVIAGDKVLLLKQNKDGFQFTSSREVLSNRENYVIVDTGKKATPEFICNMSGYAGKKARKYGLRICCIQGISPLLTSIGLKYKPMSIFDNIPSRYLGKIDE